MAAVLTGEPVREVVLDRPASANALSAELVERLHAVLDAVEAERPSALVLRGEGPHFAAGFDLSDLDAETDASLALRFLRIGLLLERLATAPFLTVAVVHGHAVGAGADLALACDHRIGTTDARLRFPGPRFGVVLGTARLAALAGPATAQTLVAGGRVDAVTAHAHGLLTDVTDRPDAAVAAVVEAWSAVDPSARPSLLDQLRPAAGASVDGALAALVRSIAVPGLRARVAAYSQTPTQEK